jgi:TorA maturation chaperone TorD
MIGAPANWALLSRLWLHEPDAAALDEWRAHAASGMPLPAASDLGELHAAYAELFLLNVWPYCTVFTDAWGEINTSDARRVAADFEAAGYAPPELSEVGAPDHLGLCLGFLGCAANSPQDTHGKFLAQVAAWAPVCCFAAEHDPVAHPFYRALAGWTREAVMAEMQTRLAGYPDAGLNRRDAETSGLPGDEWRLRHIVRFWLTPARCGLFLSRARLGGMGRALGLQLPFGARRDVGAWLFSGAGEGGRLFDLLAQLRAETGAWADAYDAWAERWPAWHVHARAWRARIDAARRLLDEMERQAREGVTVEFANRPEGGDSAAGMSRDEAA